MSDIIAGSNIQPASFDRVRDSLTNGQRIILNMLKRSVKGGISITQSDIIDAYWEANHKGKIQIECRMFLSYGKVHVSTHTKDSYLVQTKALGWFRTNLGACIIKGKILAIPVIEI